MCTWNRKHNDWPGFSESEQPNSPTQELEVSDEPQTGKTLEENLIDTLKHLHV